jgi:hypothetical protein
MTIKAMPKESLQSHFLANDKGDKMKWGAALRSLRIYLTAEENPRKHQLLLPQKITQLII